MIRRERKQAEVGIDLTACIDMTFILLIFFMVSTTFVKDMKIDIDRPGAHDPDRWPRPSRCGSTSTSRAAPTSRASRSRCG